MCDVALFLAKISVRLSESVCRPGNRNKRDDKWKDRSGETPDSTARCNRLQESHWSGKRYCAKYNYLDKDKTVVCLIKLYLASAHFQSSVMRKKAQRTQIRTILWQSLSWQLHLLLHQRRMPPRLTQRLHQPYLQ